MRGLVEKLSKGQHAWAFWKSVESFQLVTGSEPAQDSLQ